MDLFQAQDFMKEMYPSKDISFEFDDNCHRIVEMVFTNGSPHLMHHVECNKVKVNIPGEPSRYVPISPHRITTTLNALVQYLSSKKSVFIHETQKKSFQDAQDDNEKEAIIKKLVDQSGLSSDEIRKQLS